MEGKERGKGRKGGEGVRLRREVRVACREEEAKGGKEREVMTHEERKEGKRIGVRRMEGMGWEGICRSNVKLLPTCLIDRDETYTNKDEVNRIQSSSCCSRFHQPRSQGQHNSIANDPVKLTQPTQHASR